MSRYKAFVIPLLVTLALLCLSSVPVRAQVDAKPDLTFTCLVLFWDDISVDTGAGLKLQMPPIGVKFNLLALDDDPMYTRLYQEPRDFAVYEMSHGYEPYVRHVWDRMHSDNIIDWGGNCYGIDNASVDTAIDDLTAATPATAAAKARIVQLYAKQNIPYIPLYLSDDTHAIRKEWLNYTMKKGGIFTSFNPQTVVFMYDENWPTPMEFVMAYSSDIGELNPMFFRSERSHWYDMLVYDTLISYDMNLNPIPWLAEDYAVSSDGMQVNFTLRTGALWHDLTPVTPQDVNFTMYHYKNAPEDADAWAFMQYISSTDITDQTITINLDRPFGLFGLNIFGTRYILPKHIREGIPADDARWDDYTNVTAQTGSGPFKYDSRVPTEWTKVVRFDNWWGPDNPYVNQLPNIDSIRIDVVVGQDARILAMRADEVDSERYEVYGPYVATVLAAPELKLVVGLASQWDYVLGFNVTTKVAGYPGLGLADLRVRTAISHAINRQQLINIGRLGFGTPTNSVIPAEFYPGLYNQSGVFPEFDVTKANNILDAAGYIDIDSDGVREFPGVQLPTLPPLYVWWATWGPIVVGVLAVVVVIGMVATYLIMRRRKGS